MATINNQLHDEGKRREIALELMEAYVSLTCCCIFFNLFVLTVVVAYFLLHPSVPWKRLTFSVPISLSSCPRRKLVPESQRLYSMPSRGILLLVFSVFDYRMHFFMYAFQPFGETLNAAFKSQENEIVFFFSFHLRFVTSSRRFVILDSRFARATIFEEK